MQHESNGMFSWDSKNARCILLFATDFLEAVLGLFEQRS